MPDCRPVTAVHFTPAPEAQRGLLGWLSCRYGDLLLDGIAVRRTRDGRMCLSFPTRHDRHGRQHHLVRPADDASRRAIERVIFDAIHLDAEAAP
ncbi:MAG: hypothetical protein DRQ55_09720 [Planctomycetota bacterium]|nr:MAG: hypothetical protein DRQ55_09720 [Planctomycetota bacterium]